MALKIPKSLAGIPNLGLLGSIRHHVSPDPFGNLRWALTALMEFSGDDLLPIRKNLEAAETQMSFPEWSGNAHLQQALRITRAGLERRIAGASMDQIRPMIQGASMSLKAASLRKASPWPDLVSRMEHLKIPIEEAEGVIRSESAPSSIVSAIKQSMAEASVLNWDEDPASKRIAQADRLIQRSRVLASQGEWEDATKALFGASLLAKIIKKSPVSKAEKRQAGQILEAIPEEKAGLQSFFKTWVTRERMRQVQREISPLPEDEGEMRGTNGLGSLGWSVYFPTLQMLENFVQMAKTGHNPQVRAELALKGATEIIQKLHQGEEPQLTRQELELLIEGSMKVILDANEILGKERIETPVCPLYGVRGARPIPEGAQRSEAPPQ